MIRRQTQRPLCQSHGWNEFGSAKIRTVRSVLSALRKKNGHQMNDETLRTLMCETEAVVNSRPLAAEGATSSDTAEPLTPNHFLTLKTNVVLLPPGKFTSTDLYSRKWWRWVQHLTNEFWSSWKKEFHLYLQTGQKWTRPRKNLQANDVVIVKDDVFPRNQWKMCRVIEAQPDQDGLLQKVMLDVSSRNSNTRWKKKSAVVNAGKTSPQASAADVRRSVKTGESPPRSHQRRFIMYHGPLEHR